VNPAQKKIKVWRENPLRFADECLNLKLDAWQEDALSSLGGDRNPRRRVAMKACTGPGKSFALAIGGWHRLLCFGEKGEHPKGAALSGEGRDNLKDNLWAELSKIQQRSEILKSAFTWTKERIYAVDHPETWFLSARSYAKDADSESIGRSLSGLHSAFPFILLDEIGDMSIAVGQKTTQIFTGGVKDALIMAAGNPTSTTGLLYQIATTDLSFWKLITITADPDDPKRTPRVDPEHAREQIARYGRDNPWVMATILGLFPPGGINSLMSVEDVNAAMNRHFSPQEYQNSQYRLGVDVARFGNDRTVIFPRQGLAAFDPIIMRNMRSNDIAARVMSEKHQRNSEAEFVDGTGGYGSGVIDSMMQAGTSPFEINFASKALSPDYYNRRAEMWFKLAEWVKRGALPMIPDLVKELTAPTYSFVNGTFKLEEKEQIKKRLGFSPDLGDSLALTFSLPDMPSRSSVAGVHFSQHLGKAQYEYDPHA
jgi:phage terminase large subunit